ncbi:MAG: beta-ketoacyl-ACP synthase III [Chlamydiota bacterium]
MWRIELVSSLKARIIGTGSYVPEKILSNADLEVMVDTSDDWITSRTGMKERRIAHLDESTSDLGFYAAQRALDDAAISAQEIDVIMVATMTPDYITPSTAALIQAKLGISQVAAFDFQAACTGFIYGLSMAKAFVESGIYRNILLIAPEKMSAVVDYQDRSTCVLFGDGAGAAVISCSGSGFSLNQVSIGADGEQSHLLEIPAGGSRYPASQKTLDTGMHYLQMNGKETFKHAVRQMEIASKECLKAAGIAEEDLSWVVPHQANIRIIDAIAKRFAVDSQKVYKTVHKYGNTSSSSVIIALDELLQKYSLEEGEHILMTAFGAGLTWGAAVITKIGGLDEL